MVVLKNEHSFLQAVVDIVGFLVISIGYIVLAVVKLFLPSSYHPTKNLCGEVVLITGGGGGLGRLLASRFAEHKATVVVWDVNEKGVQETVEMVRMEGGKAFGYRCDVTNRHDVYHVAEKTTQEVGQVTILINNAGVASGFLFLDIPDELIQKTFEVNAISHFWTTKAFLPRMMEEDHGHIVTIASMAGHVGSKKLVDYCSSKFAAVGFDEALRVELDALGIRGVKTTIVSPYFIKATGMFGDVSCRFMPTLKPTDVADRIILGVQREEIQVFIPAFLRYTFWLKWLFPWAIISMFLRNMVPDANPSSTAVSAPIKQIAASLPQKSYINGTPASSDRLSPSERKL